MAPSPTNVVPLPPWDGLISEKRYKFYPLHGILFAEDSF